MVTKKNELMDSALDELYAAGPGTAVTARAQARLRQTLAGVARPVGAARPATQAWYDVLPRSPIGAVFVAVSARGLRSVRFGLSERQFVDDLRRQDGVLPVRSSARAGAAARQVREYLAGRRTHFDVPVDLDAVTDFQREVLMAACQIPRGQVRTYADIARQIGRPKAARAVGQALSRNPVPIVVPCHRVLAADGSLRGYTGGGGIRTKEQLLRLEGAVWPNDISHNA